MANVLMADENSMFCTILSPLGSQVKKVNLSKEESLTILGLDGSVPELLANETMISEGQVIRSTTNQVQIHYRSLKQTNHGIFTLHYQGSFF